MNAKICWFGTAFRFCWDRLRTVVTLRRVIPVHFRAGVVTTALLAAVGFTAGWGFLAERSQSRRKSSARSMASERDVTPSFW
jgi:hypothetical protein